LRCVALSSVVAFAAGCANDVDASLTGFIGTRDELSTLRALIETTRLDRTLADDGPFTVFAPSDAAFADFEEAHPGVLSTLPEGELEALVRYHIVPRAIGSTQFVDGQPLPTLLDEETLSVTVVDESLTVAGAHVVNADFLAQNGVLHVVDQVLVPPGLLDP
jgi:uncharacterized surface protein with fasciclin (FAS1) repeats